MSGYRIQTASRITAGARNIAVTRYARPRPGSPPSGGAPAYGGSALMLGLLMPLLLVRRRRGRLELRGGAVDVLGVLQEVLQDLPLALTRRAAEGRRSEVGHVEPEDLRLGQRRRGRAGEDVRIRA